jgi:hypothetical protein
LASAVRQKAQEHGITLKVAAVAMGLTYTHLMALCSGERRFGSLPRQRMARVASFVGLPVVQCYLMDGVFAPEDFVAPADLARRLALSLAKMRTDPEWGGFAPAEPVWAQWPQEARLLVCLLYERASGEATRVAARRRP